MPLAKYINPPRDLKGFPDAKRVKPKGKNKRWKDSDGNIYEWDSLHGRVEVFDKRGHHKGEFDADSGERTKPANPEYRVEP
jgi:hypothetical protein